jgi:O-antigen ligase
VIETAFLLVCFAVLAAGGLAVLAWLAFARPRLGLYAILALAPTQFIFIPVGSFFLSPADVLVIACAAGLGIRVLAGKTSARAAVAAHVLLLLVLTAYLAGFVVLNDFSRTLIRVPMAIVPSMLACELLRTRRHFVWALSALVAAAVLDAAYGLAFVAMGHPLHPTRFSGMMGVNFSAMVILTGSALAFGLVARSRQPVKLLLPGLLALMAAATLSKTGFLALFLAGGVVLWTVATHDNRRRVLAAAAVVLLTVLGHDSLREGVLARTRAQLEQDGVERTSGDIRVRLTEIAGHAFQKHPVTGIGFSNFQSYSTTDAEIRRSTFGVGYPTHNTYLEVLAEGGLLAFVPFVLHFLFIAAHWRRALPVLLADRNVILAAVLAGLIVVTVTAWAVNLLLLYLFWSVCGLALACGLRSSGQYFGAGPLTTPARTL